MPLFNRKTSDTDPAIAEYKAAKAALDANQAREIAAGINEPTEEYERLNAAVNDAMRNVPWHRR